jgi:hypothetical protein
MYDFSFAILINQLEGIRRSPTPNNNALMSESHYPTLTIAGISAYLSRILVPRYARSLASYSRYLEKHLISIFFLYYRCLGGKTWPWSDWHKRCGRDRIPCRMQVQLLISVLRLRFHWT